MARMWRSTWQRVCLCVCVIKRSGHAQYAVSCELLRGQTVYREENDLLLRLKEVCLLSTLFVICFPWAEVRARFRHSVHSKGCHNTVSCKVEKRLLHPTSALLNTRSSCIFAPFQDGKTSQQVKRFRCHLF